MARYSIHQVDSFTDRSFAGNPAGVVPNAGGLDARQMQQIARELNNSETVFLLPGTAEDHDIHLRFFTPTIEVPSCGHATIAALHVMAEESIAGPGRIRYRNAVGIFDGEIGGRDEAYRLTMHQAPYQQRLVTGAVRESVLAALDVKAGEIHPDCPIMWASTGHSKLIVGLQSRQKLAGLAPDMAALEALAEASDARGYFVFCFADSGADNLTHGRMFAPQIGIAEDPVTGNGNGPLGGYLVANSLVKPVDGEFTFIGRQGDEADRPGSVRVTVRQSSGTNLRVAVAGDAVTVFRAEIEV